MARTDIAMVRAILPTATTLTDAQIHAAIDAATGVVDQGAAGCGQELSDACLTQVETYTAAHFAAVTENTLTLSSETDPCCGGEAMYGFKFGTGVLGTPFGQMANTLSCGCLQQQDKQPAMFFSIGTHGNDDPISTQSH